MEARAAGFAKACVRGRRWSGGKGDSGNGADPLLSDPPGLGFGELFAGQFGEPEDRHAGDFSAGCRFFEGEVDVMGRDVDLEFAHQQRPELVHDLVDAAGSGLGPLRRESDRDTV